MFLKWERDRTPGWKHKAIINGLGAIVTLITVILIGITKFLNGAWLDGETVTVVLSQFVITKWWHNILHNQTGYFIKSMLYKNRNVAALTVPYIIKE